MRIIARLDIKNNNVVKGINYEGLRIVGNPVILAKKYYENGVDEIFFIDCVASLYGQNNLTKIIFESTKRYLCSILCRRWNKKFRGCIFIA